MTGWRSILPRRWAVAIVAAALIASAVVGGAALQGCAHNKTKSPQQQAQADYRAYQQRVREVVKDPARADQVIALTDELRREIDEVYTKLAQSRAQLETLNANYNATRADYDAFLKQQDAERQALTDKAISVRVEIGKLLTESEWKTLRKYGVEAVDSGLKALAS
jgi:septal ring factor EnvC (AmiA/AmiB activator)